MKNINPKEIGARIRALRQARDLSRKAYGKATDINPMTLYLYEERGRIPNPESLLKIASFSETSIDWILTGDDLGMKIPTNSLLKKDALKLLEDYYNLNKKHQNLIQESIASFLKSQK